MEKGPRPQRERRGLGGGAAGDLEGEGGHVARSIPDEAERRLSAG